MAKIKISFPKAKLVISQQVLYTALSAAVTIAYTLIVSGTIWLFENLLQIDNPLIIGLSAFAMALLFFPIHQSLKTYLLRVFHNSFDTYQAHLQNLALELMEHLTINQIAQILSSHINEAFHPELLYIFLVDHEEKYYKAISSTPGIEITEVIFPEDSNLAKTLIEQDSLQFDFSNIPSLLISDHARIQLVGCNIFLPLPSQDDFGINGWVALRQDIGASPFTKPQVLFIQTMVRQTAIAIERSIAISNLENQTQEMEILNRISEGVTSTLHLDDILELLYHQITNNIPADDFLIKLYDKKAKSFLNLFVIEDNQRINSKENQLIQAKESPSMRIISTGNTIQSKNYSTDFGINNTGLLFEWMGTPLKSNDDIIGVISLGVRTPDYQYSPTQRKILESIAGLAASAILKTRLINEINRRALQFSVLNEISQQLNSTFDLDILLKAIVEKAEFMLECEAGSLLLFDDNKHDLFFRFVTGPVASQLLNKPIEHGTGIAWRTVEKKESIINNFNLKLTTWNSTFDKDTGFTTRAMLTAPLIARGEVIGVIEIINKRSGLPFNDTDAEIIEAFAAQAAIAIENARLYTQTDEALSARVEELSIMQNIDRELNTTLDIEKAMQITLDHAMLRANADAAFIGSLVELEDKIIVMACDGYEDNTVVEKQADISIHRYPHINRIISTRIAESILVEGNAESILPGAKRQTIIPILRKNIPVAVLVLETHSDKPLHEDMLHFLTRLVDHASISIYNAELYAQVQEANLAKSDFVSFVSHVLKNPMTSIKGYTDLLLTGAVGEVTDPQKNFLQTVSSNVSRMDMLVSDLSDISRIEAGRLILDFSKFNLMDSVDEVIRSQSTMLKEKKQQVILTIPKTLPHIWGDRFRVVQVLTNLISNANKYSPTGTNIFFTADISQNIWDKNGAPMVVHIRIKDSGMGISPEDEKKIFTKFFRTFSAMVSDAPGTGLGLNITKKLVEMQGGQIWFESDIEKGTTFHITLPIAD
ncbi:MAG: GAF domain-containing protein [Anaerolineaceae bacterium]|nr:GAF domain-containing protein [Anaerolineaceae bacterium]